MKVILLLCVYCLILSSCYRPVYLPIEDQVSGLKEKGDFVVGASPILSTWMYLQFAASYSPIEKLGVSYNFVNNQVYNRHTIGIGTYSSRKVQADTISKYGGKFDIYPFYSWGNVNLESNYFTSSTPINKMHFQQFKIHFGYSYTFNILETGVSFRLAKNDITKLVIYDLPNENILELKKIDGELYPEIGANLGLSFTHFKIYGGFNGNFYQSNPDYIDKFNLYGGFQISLNTLKL